MFLRLTCLFAAALSMPGVPRKAIDSADMMRAITDDRFALKLMQKLMQPLSMVATNMFLICSSSFPGSSGGTLLSAVTTVTTVTTATAAVCCHYCCLLSPLLSASCERLHVRLAR